MKMIELFTDGACRGNPGPGGWGVLLRYRNNGDITEKQLWGSVPHTTNNRMELTAAIEGLKVVADRYDHNCEIHVTTDSQYVRLGVTRWLANWKRKAWKTADKKPVKNIDLWQILDKLSSNYQINWYWVRGHTGHEENETADQLANRAIDEWLNRDGK